MTALAADKNRVRAGQSLGLANLPIEANTRIYAGAGVVRNAAGRAAPATTATGLATLGVAVREYNNAGGAAAALDVEVLRGEYFFTNSGGGDAITNANVDADCYWVDDDTVALTSATGTRSVAGTIVKVDATYGVLVRVGVGV